MSQPIPDEVRRVLFRRAKGQCECRGPFCKHHKVAERCPHGLGPGWDGHHIDRDGPSVASNLTAMCATCHKNTPSFGKPKTQLPVPIGVRQRRALGRRPAGLPVLPVRPPKRSP